MSKSPQPELSSRNKYHLEKHRYYELRHFCLQYPIWKKRYLEIPSVPMHATEEKVQTSSVCDLTAIQGIRRAQYWEYMTLVERTTKDADSLLWHYILRGVTEDLSYSYLQTMLGIPCSRDTYYDRYRKFFWLLNERRI